MLEEVLHGREVIKNPNRVIAEEPHEITYATLEDLVPLLFKSKASGEDSNRRTAPRADEPKLVGVTLPAEVSTAEAARILGVSKDTVLKLKEAGLLEYRNLAPPTSVRAVFRFLLASVLELRNSYQTDFPTPPILPQPQRRRVRQKQEPKYKHLRVD